MMPSIKSLLSTAALLSLAHAETHTITACEDNSFEPDDLKAAEGDVIEFHFERGNHSVVAGNYDFPCSPLQLGDGFFSGFMDTDEDMANQVFRVRINDTEPIVFYSSVGNQCPDGMVGIINSNDEWNLNEYRDNASGLATAVSPGSDVYGGEITEDAENDTTDNNDDNNDDNNEDGSNNDGEGGGSGAAGAMAAPVLSLLAAVGIAVALA